MVGKMVFEYRSHAMVGLGKALNVFSEQNSDAILAASLVLSWQATDWRSWTQHMQGTRGVGLVPTDFVFIKAHANS